MSCPPPRCDRWSLGTRSCSGLPVRTAPSGRNSLRLWYPGWYFDFCFIVKIGINIVASCLSVFFSPWFLSGEVLKRKDVQFLKNEWYICIYFVYVYIFFTILCVFLFFIFLYTICQETKRLYVSTFDRVVVWCSCLLLSSCRTQQNCRQQHRNSNPRLVQYHIKVSVLPPSFKTAPPLVTLVFALHVRRRCDVKPLALTDCRHTPLLWCDMVWWQLCFSNLLLLLYSLRSIFVSPHVCWRYHWF